ncbi:MAG: ligase-associated DNA damage response endonuclease PdeM [Saprospiraceae bacterium]|nr:ligase-associated DNA damage response endonuclease PdeM [Saprospiraceae bacterium]
MNTVVHHINNHRFLLLPEKAIIWENKKTLLVADLHLGKITHFRKAGIAVPAAAKQENLSRLSDILLNYRIDRVIILGDLFHSHYNATWLDFKQFIAQFIEIQFILVMGNHDILEAKQYQAPNLEIVPEGLMESEFILTHHPYLHEKAYNLCGHIHPAIRLRGASKQSITLPCFIFSKSQAILPSFGTFTGSARIEPKKDDVVYAITDQEVIKVL